MKMFLFISLVSIYSHVSMAKEKKIDWSLCETEIKEFCSKEKDDHGKHECLEKLPKEKVSDECREKNEKLESQFKGKHNHKH